MKNENAALPNLHTLYIGMTGSGKSQCLKQRCAIPPKARVLLFDPNRDHAADYRVSRASEFAAKLAELERSGATSYRLAWTPVPGVKRPAAHEIFCQCIWLMLDGRKRTYVIDEELAQSCRSPMRADPWHGMLINEGRKFGLIYHGAVQLPQRVPKDIYDACDTLYIGRSLRLPKYVNDRLPKEIVQSVPTMPDLFFHRVSRHGIESIKLKYKK